MIIDTLDNAARYFSIHPSFAKAFDYISRTDWQNTEGGKFEIDGDQLKASLSHKKGMTTEESVAKFECHDHHIDIQLCISGHETFGWRPRATCQSVKGEYNPEKDVSFYNDTPDMFFQLTDGQFVILFPEDVHAPMIGDGDIKKLVIKVKI